MEFDQMDCTYNEKTSIENSYGESLPKVPEYLILNTVEIVRAFRQAVQLSEADVAECVTQVLDRIMDVGLVSTCPIYPVLGMLRSGRDMLPEQQATLSIALSNLYFSMKHYLLLIKASTGEHSFNYGFYSLRGDNVMVRHFFPY